MYNLCEGTEITIGLSNLLHPLCFVNRHVFFNTVTLHDRIKEQCLIPTLPQAKTNFQAPSNWTTTSNWTSSNPLLMLFRKGGAKKNGLNSFKRRNGPRLMGRVAQRANFPPSIRPEIKLLSGLLLSISRVWAAVVKGRHPWKRHLFRWAIVGGSVAISNILCWCFYGTVYLEVSTYKTSVFLWEVKQL